MRRNDPNAEPRAAELLDQVYAALRRSDYAGLAGLTASLERELHAPNEPYSEAGLQTIRRKADRNAACLVAAQRGIKSARRRVMDIRASASGLVTYDKSGRRAEVSAEVSDGRNLAQRL